MASSNRENTRGRIILLLIALPFSLISLGMFSLAVMPSLYDWTRMQSWVQVQAQLVSANLESHPGEKDTTYRVVAKYRYDYQGGNYTGSRVGISEKSDNIGNWHQQTYSHLQSMQPLLVWVNPNAPHEAIFDRDLRWTKLWIYMIFVLVFGAIGAGLFWLGLRKPVAIQEGVPLWLGNPAWRDNQIRSNAKAGVWIIWAVSVLFILGGSPALIIFPGEWAKGNHHILLALLFPIAVLGIVAYAMKRTLEWRRFGNTLLTLDPFPGLVGGEVGGNIRINQVLQHDAVANVRLSCVHVYTRTSGDENETVHDVKWQDEQQTKIEPGINGNMIRFRFTTPDDLPESTVDDIPGHEWVLQVTSALPGVNLERRFAIPVFKTHSSKQSARLSRSVANLSGDTTVPARIMRVSQTGNGLRLYFPFFHARNPGLAYAVSGGLTLGYALFFMHVAAPLKFIIVFGGVGTLLFLPGLYLLSNSLTVVANSRGIDVTRRIFGLPIHKHITASNIRTIDVSMRSQTQSNNPIVHYSVKLFTRDGKKITVAESLTGISAAEQVARQIRQACNLRS